MITQDKRKYYILHSLTNATDDKIFDCPEESGDISSVYRKHLLSMGISFYKTASKALVIEGDHITELQRHQIIRKNIHKVC